MFPSIFSSFFSQLLVKYSLFHAGPSGNSGELVALSVSSHTILLSWLNIYCQGFEQNKVLLLIYSPDYDPLLGEHRMVIDTAHLEITGLIPRTRYEFTIYNSTYTGIYSIASAEITTENPHSK